MWLKAAAEPEARAMPMDPRSSACRGIQPGDASTMPTMAVNTMSRLTFGLVSSRKSRHWGAATAENGLSGTVDMRQGYQHPQQRYHANDQQGGACIMHSGQGQGHAEMHHGDAAADPQQ